MAHTQIGSNELTNARNLRDMHFLLQIAIIFIMASCAILIINKLFDRSFVRKAAENKFHRVARISELSGLHPKACNVIQAEDRSEDVDKLQTALKPYRSTDTTLLRNYLKTTNKCEMCKHPVINGIGERNCILVCGHYLHMSCLRVIQSAPAPNEVVTWLCSTCNIPVVVSHSIIKHM